MGLAPLWTRQFEGAPLIGDWIANAGQVVKILTSPCEIAPQIYVTAFFQELPYLAWGLLKPDALDLRARDIGTDAGRPHRPRNRRQKKRRLMRFRVDELLAGQFVKKHPIPEAVFNLGQLAQRVGYFILVMDLTSEFLVRWHSTAYQWSGCQAVASWYKGISGNAPSPAGGSGTTAWPWEFETAGSTPDTFVGSLIKQPATSEIRLNADVTFVRAQFQTGSASVDCYLEDTLTGARYYLFEGQTVSSTEFASGSITHFAPRILEDRFWRIVTVSGDFRIITTFNSTFDGWPPTDNFLDADPP